MLLLPSDPNVVAFLAQRGDAADDMQISQLMHMADPRGLPGSMTEGGHRFKEATYRWDYLNLLGIIYALKQNWVALDEVTLPAEPFS